MDDIISDIPGNLQQKLADLLDRRRVPNWKTFVEAIPDNLCSFEKGDFELLRLAILKPKGSPTIKMIEKLGSKNVKVCHFIDVLEKIRPNDDNIHKALDLFMGEPPLILLEPPSQIRFNVGDVLEVLCDATGCQPLMYQWFKGSTILETQTERKLSIKSVEIEHGGMYTCRVSNVRGYQFSRWLNVLVGKQDSETSNEVDLSSSPIASYKDVQQPCIHPETVTLPYGSLLSLFCDSGDEHTAAIAQSFQWFKDEEEIPGATNRELIISPVSQDHQGTYSCRLFNDTGSVHSRSSQVHITKAQLFKRGVSHEIKEVSDKVALLIGNKDYDNYRHLGILHHPTNDVSDIAGVLQSIGFKVISLVNLTLEEMKQALHVFSNYITSGVYALFYFAGHGFEANGKSYLMPTDASHQYKCTENLASNEILRIMKEKEAKLKVLLFDCCRTTPQTHGEREFHDPISSGGLNTEQENVVIAFGCCSQGRVFEHGSKRNGYFAMHLLEHLGHANMNIEQVLLDTAKGVREEQIFDSYTGQIQMVFRYSSLVENWCLSDKISVDERSKLPTFEWNKIHEIQHDPLILYKKNNVELILRFYAEFSNVLTVRATLDTDDVDVILEPLKLVLPNDKNGNGCLIEEIAAGSDGHMMSSGKLVYGELAVKISHLQRLQGLLTLHFKLSYIKSNNAQINELVSYTFDEKPLYAKLVENSSKVL